MARSQKALDPASSANPHSGNNDFWHSFWSERPFTFMQRMAEEMDRQFTHMIGDARNRIAPWFAEYSAGSQWLPHVEIVQTDGQLKVRADLPGLKKEDVRVELDDNTLVIDGERRSDSEDQRGGVRHTERRYGHFTRRIGIPEGIEPESIAARFEDGVLEICIPCSGPGSNRRRIEIQSAETDCPQRSAAEHSAKSGGVRTGSEPVAGQRPAQ